jgi:hypothetical protein
VFVLSEHRNVGVASLREMKSSRKAKRPGADNNDRITCGEAHGRKRKEKKGK